MVRKPLILELAELLEHLFSEFLAQISDVVPGRACPVKAGVVYFRSGLAPQGRRLAGPTRAEFTPKEPHELVEFRL